MWSTTIDQTDVTALEEAANKIISVAAEAKADIDLLPSHLQKFVYSDFVDLLVCILRVIVFDKCNCLPAQFSEVRGLLRCEITRPVVTNFDFSQFTLERDHDSRPLTISRFSLRLEKVMERTEFQLTEKLDRQMNNLARLHRQWMCGTHDASQASCQQT